MNIDNSLNIGGVNFRKDDVQSSEVIVKDGQELNSVFLNDGTHIVYPNQDETKNPKITQYDEVNMRGNAHDGMQYYSTGNKNTDFERLSGAEITGTNKKDTYILKGCDNTKVDLSQNDGKSDKVVQKDSKVDGEKVKSTNNTVTLGDKKDKVTNMFY